MVMNMNQTHRASERQTEIKRERRERGKRQDHYCGPFFNSNFHFHPLSVRLFLHGILLIVTQLVRHGVWLQIKSNLCSNDLIYYWMWKFIRVWAVFSIIVIILGKLIVGFINEHMEIYSQLSSITMFAWGN